MQLLMTPMSDFNSLHSRGKTLHSTQCAPRMSFSRQFSPFLFGRIVLFSPFSSLFASLAFFFDSHFFQFLFCVCTQDFVKTSDLLFISNATSSPECTSEFFCMKCYTQQISKELEQWHGTKT